MSGVSTEPTRYAVECRVHGLVFMTREEYNRQLMKADALWECPHEGCDEAATFSDDNYELY